MSDCAIDGPLCALRVLELGSLEAGSMAAEILALLGAEVIKVEPPSGDPRRKATRGPDSHRFILANLSKRSVTLQLAGEAGRDAAARLSARSDVVVESLPPGDADRLGLGSDVLQASNSRLIYLRLSGFADDSPHIRVAPTEAVVQSLGGTASVTGEPDGPPQRCGPDAATQSTAIYGCIGALAAVLERARTGVGQRVEVAMQDAVINLARTHFSRTAESGNYERRSGNRQPAAPAEPTGAFPTLGGGLDDYVFIHAAADHFWARLLRVIGREDLLRDPRFSSGPDRLAHRQEVHDLIVSWTLQHGKWDLLRSWGHNGVPIGATLSTDDLLHEPSLLDTGLLARVGHQQRGELVVPTLPYNLTGSRMRIAPAPMLGEHNREVLGSLLGLSSGEIESAQMSSPSARPVSSSMTRLSHGRAVGPPLSGIRVLDLTQALAGPTATQALAFLGADVIHVERPEESRFGTERPWLQLDQLAMNKRSISVDLKTESGREVARRLAREVDVVMENFGPGTIDRLGLGWDQLAALNPRVVFGQIKGFPRGSPYEEFLSFEPIGEAMGGACSLTGDMDGPPMLPGPHLADIGSGLACALGVLACLCQRLRTGRGDAVLSSMQGTVLTLFARSAFAEQLETERAAPRNAWGNRGELVAPAGVFRCMGGGSNDYCYLRCSSQDDWLALLSAIGRLDLAEDPRLATPQERWRHRALVTEVVTRWTRQLDKRQAMEILVAAGVEAAAVLDTLELTEESYLRRRGLFKPVEHPSRGTVQHVCWPVLMDHLCVELRAAPRRGEHTQAVMRELLGATAEEIECHGPMEDGAARPRKGVEA